MSLEVQFIKPVLILAVGNLLKCINHSHAKTASKPVVIQRNRQLYYIT